MALDNCCPSESGRGRFAVGDGQPRPVGRAWSSPRRTEKPSLLRHNLRGLGHSSGGRLDCRFAEPAFDGRDGGTAASYPW